MKRHCFFLLLGLAACAGTPQDRSPVDAAEFPEASAEQDIEAGSAEAVRDLVVTSRRFRASGEFARAQADIERALRIDPRNPYLWLELGETHLSRGDAGQAAATARRAMSVAGPDGVARRRAERLLDRASRQ